MKTEEGKDIPFAMQSTIRSETKRVFDGSPEEQERQKQECGGYQKQRGGGYTAGIR